MHTALVMVPIKSQNSVFLLKLSHSTQCTLIACAQMSLMSAHADEFSEATVMPAKSDSDVVFCLQLLSKTLTCTLHLNQCESIYHVCINAILRIGLMHK